MKRATHTSQPARRAAKPRSFRVNLYGIIADRLDEQLEGDIRRAFKHREDCPCDEAIANLVDNVHVGVMNTLSEIIKFDQGD